MRYLGFAFIIYIKQGGELNGTKTGIYKIAHESSRWNESALLKLENSTKLLEPETNSNFTAFPQSKNVRV